MPANKFFAVETVMYAMWISNYQVASSANTGQQFVDCVIELNPPETFVN